MPVSAAFYTSIREALFKSLTQEQVDSLNAITAVFDSFTGHDHCIDDLAYIMATCYHECGGALNLAVEEIGRGRGKPYGVPVNGLVYYGRGPVQITWLTNYQKAKLATGTDFVGMPALMLIPRFSLVYMIYAMYNGSFTSVGLRTYIKPGVKATFAEFGECRRIVNGVDHKDLIAGYAIKFAEALRAGYVAPLKSLPTQIQQPPQLPQSLGLWAQIRKFFGGK